VIRIGNVTSGNVDVYYSGEITDNLPIVVNGDLIVSLTGDFNIREWKNNSSILNQRCGLIHVLDSDIYKRHLYYHIPFSFLELEKTKFITTLKNLSNSDFLNISFPLPPLSEQEQIVSYLDEKTSEIDKTIELENKKIELLKEYRQSLISNVVTGKIKVVSE